ncbi:Hypothetical predicted protein, partial [Olea europaea subsp. europaea]
AGPNSEAQIIITTDSGRGLVPFHSPDFSHRSQLRTSQVISESNSFLVSDEREWCAEARSPHCRKAEARNRNSQLVVVCVGFKGKRLVIPRDMNPQVAAIIEDYWVKLCRNASLCERIGSRKCVLPLTRYGFSIKFLAG